MSVHISELAENCEAVNAGVSVTYLGLDNTHRTHVPRQQCKQQCRQQSYIIQTGHDYSTESAEMFPLKPFQIFAIVNHSNLRGPSVLNQSYKQMYAQLHFLCISYDRLSQRPYVEEPSHPERDAVSFGEQFPMLQWILVRPGSSRL